MTSLSTDAAQMGFVPAWPSRPPAPPAAVDGAGRYRPPPLHALAAEPPRDPPPPRRVAPPPLTFSEDELVRAFGAGVAAGLRATSLAAAAQRDRMTARALRLLHGVRRRLAAAQTEELDRIADHVAEILGVVIADLAPAAAPAHAAAALRGLLRDALAAGAGQGTLTIETSADVVAALRPASADETAGPIAAAVALRVDPDLPADALRARWSSGWAEAHADNLARLLRERLAAAIARPMEGAAP